MHVGFRDQMTSHMPTEFLSQTTGEIEGDGNYDGPKIETFKFKQLLLGVIFEVGRGISKLGSQCTRTTEAPPDPSE